MKHQSNFENLRRTMLREGPPGPVPFFEIGAEPGVMGAVLGEKSPLDLQLFRPPSPLPPGEEDTRAAVRTLDLFVKFSVEMGYDYVFMFVPFKLPRHVGQTVDPAAPPGWSDGFRYWENEVKGPIQSWEDFEKYPRPNPEEILSIGARLSPLGYLSDSSLSDVSDDSPLFFLRVGARTRSFLISAEVEHLPCFLLQEIPLERRHALLELVLTLEGNLDAGRLGLVATGQDETLFLCAEQE